MPSLAKRRAMAALNIIGSCCMDGGVFEIFHVLIYRPFNEAAAESADQPYYRLIKMTTLLKRQYPQDKLKFGRFIIGLLRSMVPHPNG